MSKPVEDLIRRANSSSPAPRTPITWTAMATWDKEPVPERNWFIRDRIPIRQPVLLSGEGSVDFLSTILVMPLCDNASPPELTEQAFHAISPHP